MNRKKGDTSIIIIDVMAFFLIAVGAGLVRYAQNEVFPSLVESLD